MENDSALRIRNITKRFGGFVAVNNVSLDIRKHSVHALIGPNGAGKTTFFNLLTKFVDSDSGSIEYLGHDITKLRPDQIAERGIVRSFQISAVFLGMTALQNVRISLQKRQGMVYQFWRPYSVLTQLNERAFTLLSQVGLSDVADTQASELSYGRKRALEIAMTLAMEPDVLLLDEPMAGLGHEDIGRIAELIKEVAMQRTVLMVEHNLSVVADLSDVITVLQRGAVIAEGSYDVVSNDARVIEAYLGSDA